MLAPTAPRAPEVVAGVDLGSNSFHMIVARAHDGRIEVLDKLREHVRLAEGLDAKNKLSRDARDRALTCLERFGQRLKHMPIDAVRAVGTNTLRVARNGAGFLAEAESALGHPIEVISGEEEARLIYLGVSHGESPGDGRRLVIDIGGGSTECILGQGFDVVFAHSLFIGCVSHSARYFPGGRIGEDELLRAEIAARLELRTIERAFAEGGFRRAIGSSGTITATEAVLRAHGWTTDGVTLKALRKLRKALLQAGSISALRNLPGLDPERAPVFPGGVAILLAAMEALLVEELHVSASALREGLVFDVLGRMHLEDARDQTIRRLIEQFRVDRAQAARVGATALGLLEQVAKDWGLDAMEARRALGWAAELHELGLSIAYTGYHKHSAYLIENANMPGFSRRERTLLARIVLNHRRKLRVETFEALAPDDRKLAQRLCVLLRLAVAVCRSRSPEPLPPIELAARKGTIGMRFPPGWLELNALTRADLVQEAERLASAGFDLEVR